MLHGLTVSIELSQDVDVALAYSGLTTRGVFTLDDNPTFQSGVLIGHLGGGFWPNFQKWHLQHQDAANPLDAWSKTVIDSVAETVGGKAVYPSDQPYFPFQKWAKEAEGLKASPLGLLIHPTAGLWHAYRGAILFERVFDYEAILAAEYPCDRCDAKPCLTACPVNAVQLSAFDFNACRNQLAQPQGQPCLTNGCLARNACPVGQEFRYSAEQQTFHQRAFARA